MAHWLYDGTIQTLLISGSASPGPPYTQYYNPSGAICYQRTSIKFASSACLGCRFSRSTTIYRSVSFAYFLTTPTWYDSRMCGRYKVTPGEFSDLKLRFNLE
ncbi:MAG: hypothetical protein ACXW5W_10915, partial [Candidatus Binatia bacterium]